MLVLEYLHSNLCSVNSMPTTSDALQSKLLLPFHSTFAVGCSFQEYFEKYWRQILCSISKARGLSPLSWCRRHTVQCTVTLVSSRLCAGPASAERVGQGEVGGGTRRVTCTWWMLWLSVEMPWLALSGPILALFAQIGLENTALNLEGLHFLQ